MPAYYRCQCGGQAVPPQRLCDQCIWGSDTEASEPDYCTAKMWAATVNEAGRVADAKARLRRALDHEGKR